MPVTLAIEGEVMKANHVYVVPAGSDVAMSGDRLKLSPCAPRYGWPKNITRFLLSLATSHQHRAIAVILSGFDSDGAAALKEIKEAGGLVIAQQPDTAKQPSMPESAVETGHVDLILSPGAIAAHLCDIAGERQSVMQ
jgi:chemotaxis response regulator CheB